MFFVLPLPETTNHSYLSGRHGWYKSTKAAAWEQKAAWIVKTTYKEEIIDEEDVIVRIYFYIKYRRDIDGGIKPVLDLLQRQGIYKNDSQVTSLYVKKFKDIQNPRCEVEVKLIKFPLDIYI